MEASMDFVLDMGNAFWKAYCPTYEWEACELGLLAPLTEAEWQEMLSEQGAGIKPNYLKVNGKPYVIGNAAERKVVSRRSGNQRYTEDYFGVVQAYMVGSCLADLTGRTDHKARLKNVPSTLNFVAMHPPSDGKIKGFKANLKKLALGKRVIEASWGKIEFEATDFWSISEPLAGYMRATLDENGLPANQAKFDEETILIGDIGGFTLDVAVVDPEGAIDFSASNSDAGVGALAALATLEKLIKSKHKQLATTKKLPRRRLETAIQTGFYPSGGYSLDCQKEAIAAKNELLNHFTQLIASMGAEAEHDELLLTGGGSSLIYPEIKAYYEGYLKVSTATAIEELQMANCYGGARMLTMIKGVGRARA